MVIYFLIMILVSTINKASSPDVVEPGAPTILVGQRPFSPEDNFRLAAMNSFSAKIDPTIEPYVRPHFEEIVQEHISPSSSSPDSDDAGRPRILIRYSSLPNVLSNGEMTDVISEYQLNDMVARAIQRAFDARDQKIKIQEHKIERMLTRKKAAALSVVIGSIATLISSLASNFINKS